MIAVVIYFFILLLYLKLPDFQKFRDTTSAGFNISLTFVSVIVFLYSCVMIMADPYYFFGMNLTNPNLRKTALLLYIATFVTLFGFTLSHFYSKVAKKKKAPSGQRGDRGNRGDMGTDKTCSPQECNDNICYKKVSNFCSRIYNQYLKSKGIKSANGFNNRFLKNKMKLLCKSTQMMEMIKKQGSQKAYNYVTDIWKQWIHIILKYENGILFIENEYLTDNDFDNLIADNDKNFADFNDIETPGTPSSGKESPFDEMKKFDMFYWGVNVAAVPKVLYKCPNVTKGKLEVTHPDHFNDIWDSSKDRQAYISVGKMEDGECKRETKYVPFLQKGTSTIKVFRGVEKKLGKDTYFPLADTLDKNKTTLVSGDVKHPLGFEAVFKSQRREGEGIGLKGFSVWKPVAPKGYKCLGNVIDNTPTMTPPPNESIVCVPEKCTRKVKEKMDPIWENKSTTPCIGDCGCEDESGNQDTDNANPLTFYSSSGVLGTDENMYELIPSSEKNTCINLITGEDSEWVVSDKQDEKYSVFNIYNE